MRWANQRLIGGGSGAPGLRVAGPGWRCTVADAVHVMTTSSSA